MLDGSRLWRPLRPDQVAIDLGLAVVFALLTIVAPMLGSGLSWPVLVVSLLMAGALALRRLSPGLALGVAWLGAIVQMVALLNPLAANLAIPAVLYVTAAYGSRRLYWIGLGSAVGGAAVITAYLFGTGLMAGSRGWGGVPVALILFASAAFALGLSWTVGALVRASRRAAENRLAQRHAEDRWIAEQERGRIARDMHDVVAHSLAVVIAQADGARYAVAADPATDTGPTLATIATTARGALADVRLLLAQLRRVADAQPDAPQPSVADLEPLYAQLRSAGADLRVTVDPTPAGTPPAAVQLAVYRILQEALTNALRHGARQRIDVRLGWWPDHVDLEVQNATAGAGGEVVPGHGLIGMRERAQLVGGSLETTAGHQRFTVSARIPLETEPQQVPR